MRIQWSSGAAQEMLIRLERADQGLADCVRQSALVRSALDEANADGEDQALRKAKERFEACAQEIRAFAEALDDFRSAVRRADERFEDAEAGVIRMAANLSQASAAPGRENGVGERYVNWEPSAFSVLPNMRVSGAPVPEWLETVTAGSNAIPLMD